MTGETADTAEGGADLEGWWRAVGVPERLRHFAAGHDEALRRLSAIRPAEYARSRNAIDGAVTGLSPYFAHGVLGLPEALARLAQRHTLDWPHKLVFEFAWREFFHHVWAHAADDGEAILSDMRPSAVRASGYADVLPADIREGRTGVPAIDTAVRVLYRSGYLHNHARMWLASYVVHVRKCHWCAGADWMLGHLLDGDLPSNHLSWQWVAGTFSSKPYLFNAANVARYAPADALDAWASPGTAIDRSYEALDAWARAGGDSGPEPGVHEAIAEPALLAAPPTALLRTLPHADERACAGREVELVHSWALADRAPAAGRGALRIGLVHPSAHARWPWSERRWRWVLERMAQVCDAVHVVEGETAPLDVSAAVSVRAVATRFSGYREWLAAHARLDAPARWLPELPRPCASFSRYYQEVQRQSGSLTDTLAGSPWSPPIQTPLW